MRWFLLNILLALLWMFMWGSFGLYELLSGMAVGYLVILLISRIAGYKGYGKRLMDIVLFGAYFVRILIKANLQVAWEVITPGHYMTPRFIRYPVAGMTDIQITVLANAITLTPGTLSVDLSDAKEFLYIHAMYAEDRQQAVVDIDELRDRILRELFS